MGTMRNYWPTNTKYVFEWNSLFSGTAPNSAPWCTLMQLHGNSGGSPVVGLYFEGSDFVVITRSGTSGSPTEVYRYSLAGGLTYDIYHRFTMTVDWTGGINNAALRLDIDGTTRVNVAGVAIGHTNTTAFRFYWGVYRFQAPEITSHQVKNIQVTVSPVTAEQGAIALTGQNVTPS